jgi:hypothetical protein
MRFRLAYLPLLALAAAAGALGLDVLARGLFSPSYDSTIWNYLGLGVPLVVLAVAGVVVVVRDARRRAHSGE